MTLQRVSLRYQNCKGLAFDNIW